jgi:hypothetical protein
MSVYGRTKTNSRSGVEQNITICYVGSVSKSKRGDACFSICDGTFAAAHRAPVGVIRSGDKGTATTHVRVVSNPRQAPCWCASSNFSDGAASLEGALTLLGTWFLPP